MGEIRLRLSVTYAPRQAACGGVFEALLWTRTILGGDTGPRWWVRREEHTKTDGGDEIAVAPVSRHRELNRYLAGKGGPLFYALQVGELLPAVKQPEPILHESLANLLTHEHLIVSTDVVPEYSEPEGLRYVRNEIKRHLVGHDFGQVVLGENHLYFLERLLRREGLFRSPDPLFGAHLLEFRPSVHVDADAAKDDERPSVPAGGGIHRRDVVIWIVL